MTVSPVAPAAAGSASRDLSRARMALAEARETDDHLIRYSSAHVAALQVAAAVLAVRARPVRRARVAASSATPGCCWPR